MAKPESPPHFPDCWLAYGAPNDLLRTTDRHQPLAGAPGAGTLLPFQLLLATALTVTALLDVPLVVRVLAGALAVILWASAAAGALLWWGAAQAIEFTPEALVARLPLGRWRAVRWERIAAIDQVASAQRPGVGIRLKASSADGARPRGGRPPLSAGYDLLLWPRDGDHERLARVLLRFCIDPRARQRYLAGD